MTNCNLAKTTMETNEKFLKEYGAEKVNASTFRSIAGLLIYLIDTRPDVVNAVSIVSRYMHEPSKLHSAGAKKNS